MEHHILIIYYENLTFVFICWIKESYNIFMKVMWLVGFCNPCCLNIQTCWILHSLKPLFNFIISFYRENVTPLNFVSCNRMIINNSNNLWDHDIGLCFILLYFSFIYDFETRIQTLPFVTPYKEFWELSFPITSKFFTAKVSTEIIYVGIFVRSCIPEHLNPESKFPI